MLDAWRRQHATGTAAHFRLSLHTSPTLLGEVMLIDRREPGFLEVGYWLDVSAMGNGYAAEAAQAMVSLAQACADVTALRFRCDLRNLASIRVAERLGATQEADRHDHEDDALLGHWVLPLRGTSPPDTT